MAREIEGSGACGVRRSHRGPAEGRVAVLEIGGGHADPWRRHVDAGPEVREVRLVVALVDGAERDDAVVRPRARARRGEVARVRAAVPRGDGIDHAPRDRVAYRVVHRLARAAAQAHVRHGGERSIPRHPVHPRDHAAESPTTVAAQHLHAVQRRTRHHPDHAQRVVLCGHCPRHVRAVPVAILVRSAREVHMLDHVQVGMRAVDPGVDDVHVDVRHRAAVACDRRRGVRGDAVDAPGHGLVQGLHDLIRLDVAHAGIGCERRPAPAGQHGGEAVQRVLVHDVRDAAVRARQRLSETGDVGGGHAVLEHDDIPRRARLNVERRLSESRRRSAFGGAGGQHQQTGG